ncbi:hypothetical protein MMC22_002310 [Lobaria immixta]|nr:hypothetical protein [Lobaria immixta]
MDVPIRTGQDTKEQIDPSDTIPSGGKGRNGGREGNLRAPSLLRRRLKNPSHRLILEITSSNPSAATNDPPNIESADTNNMSSELNRGHEEQQSGTAKEMTSAAGTQQSERRETIIRVTADVHSNYHYTSFDNLNYDQSDDDQDSSGDEEDETEEM